MRVHYLQHVSFEGLGSMLGYFNSPAYRLSATRLYAGESLPDVDDFDWLLVMGGPMGIYDHVEYPWLKPEKALIRAAIEAGKRVLGICLGAQLIADCLGATVTRNAHREIGWFPVRFSEQCRETPLGAILPQCITAFHWHGDTFALPRGAVLLGSSEACPNQGFILDNRVFGFQFHLETDPAAAARLLRHCSEDMEHDRFVQSATEIMAHPRYFSTINQLQESVLGAIASHS